MPVRPTSSHASLATAAVVAGLLWPAGACAVMDIRDRGPLLDAGAFALRVTNIGVLGNAFFNQGLCFDPSFECPRGSGRELLNHAELWVGALGADGRPRVSGGPMLEWRPSLSDSDRVRIAYGHRPGTLRGVDDDGDGRIDEEFLDGLDNDGDGEVDEDLGLVGDQTLVATYSDDTPEAVNYGYPNGETHAPLGLAVRQEAYAWDLPGYDGIAGLEFTITNRGGRTLSGLYAGLFADFDSRDRSDPAGHLDDVETTSSFTRDIPEGSSLIRLLGAPATWTCVTHLSQTAPVVLDGVRADDLPAIALLPLSHTTDPLAFFRPDLARAPATTGFRSAVYTRGDPPGLGGPPALDEERYAALAGGFPASTQADRRGDQAVLVACGPFPSLAAGESIVFRVALVAAALDSLPAALSNAAWIEHGTRLNLQPDSVAGGNPEWWTEGRSGTNGHEACVEAPAGQSFVHDPHCPGKFARDFPEQFSQLEVPAQPALYEHGRCVWTDADCDACTGFDGLETVVHWTDPGAAPAGPASHVAAGDHEVTIAWDNLPEVLVNAGFGGLEGFHFDGYRVYKVADWERSAEIPAPERWLMLGAYGPDTLNRQIPLASITDSTVAFDRILYEQKHYPIGRYRVMDRKVLNGFDYLYIVTTVAARRVAVGGGFRIERIESPFSVTLDSVVVPHVAARGDASQVWVVPNPYRGAAPWDRPPVPGDTFGRHLDFMGLPRGRSTIRIYTVAGDLVAQVDHDGSGGDGQAPWNLISRNGQDVESGIYLFTVDSPAGHSTGRFVVIR